MRHALLQEVIHLHIDYIVAGVFVISSSHQPGLLVSMAPTGVSDS